MNDSHTMEYTLLSVCVPSIAVAFYLPNSTFYGQDLIAATLYLAQFISSSCFNQPNNCWCYCSDFLRVNQYWCVHEHCALPIAHATVKLENLANQESLTTQSHYGVTGGILVSSSFHPSPSLHLLILSPLSITHTHTHTCIRYLTAPLSPSGSLSLSHF